jgi:hypothetical protein
MCDFSLEGSASRPAIEGENLATERLGAHEVIGLVSANDRTVAVCLTSGTTLMVDGLSESARGELDLSPAGPVEAIFAQRKLGALNTGYRDGLTFPKANNPNRIVLLQDFPETELTVTVTSVAVEEEARELLAA